MSSTDVPHKDPKVSHALYCRLVQIRTNSFIRRCQIGSEGPDRATGYRILPAESSLVPTNKHRAVARVLILLLMSDGVSRTCPW